MQWNYVIIPSECAVHLHCPYMQAFWLIRASRSAIYIQPYKGCADYAVLVFSTYWSPDSSAPSTSKKMEVQYTQLMVYNESHVYMCANSF